LVVTADHVITDETSGGKPYPKLFAQRFTGTSFETSELVVVKRMREGNTGRDIAVLQMRAPPPNLPYLRIAEQVTLGGDVLIAGFPLVFDKPYPHPLIRHGVIASTRYRYEGAAVLVLDLTSVSGYSGSPVVRLPEGDVVGVFRGSSADHPDADFSVAFVLTSDDLRPTTIPGKTPSSGDLTPNPSLQRTLPGRSPGQRR